MVFLSLYKFPKRDEKSQGEDRNVPLTESSTTTPAGEENSVVAFHDDINIPLSIAIDRIRAMKKQERSKDYRCPNQYQRSSDKGSKKLYAVDEICRGKMCEWFYNVVDGCNMSRGTVALAMNYVDRLICGCSNEANGPDSSLLSSSKSSPNTAIREAILSSTSKFQLATMTCLYMAVKLNDSIVMDIDIMVQLSKNAYSKTDFKEMEISILRALQWKLNGPTSMVFVRCYFALWLQLASKKGINLDHDLIEDMISDARYQTEIAVAESSFVTCYPSLIALASVFNSIDTHITRSGKQQKDILLLGLVELTGESNRWQDEEMVTNMQKNLKLLLAGVPPSYNVSGYDQATTATNENAENDYQTSRAKLNTDYDSVGTADTDTETDSDCSEASITEKNPCLSDSEGSPVRVSTSTLI